MLVPKHVVADGSHRAQAGRIAHIIVSGADEVASIALFDQFDYRARRRERDIIGMSLKYEKYFPFMGLARGGAFKKNSAGRRGRMLLWGILLWRSRQGCQAPRCNQTAQNISS